MAEFTWINTISRVSDALYVDKVNTNTITDISVKVYLYLYKKRKIYLYKNKVYITRIKYFFLFVFCVKNTNWPWFLFRFYFLEIACLLSKNVKIIRVTCVLEWKCTIAKIWHQILQHCTIVLKFVFLFILYTDLYLCLLIFMWLFIEEKILYRGKYYLSD